MILCVSYVLLFADIVISGQVAALHHMLTLYFHTKNIKKLKNIKSSHNISPNNNIYNTDNTIYNINTINYRRKTNI